ncbi:MAG: glycosyltransferase family 4 protein, partial [Candidatus Obscuribacterales bacterium]|nr:glycosyltransferase family 4 protein [Candidatus Obscuribacterales bacterium]
MRVCIISREYPPDTGFGGIATFANHLAHGLKDLGHEVIVVSLAKDIPKDVIQNGIPVYRVEAAGITANTQLISRYIPYATYALGASSALWRKFLELHKEKAFDVVDTPELLAEGLLPAITKAAPLLIRLYTPHSKFIDEQFHNINASFDHQFIAMTERLAMLSADVLTSPSHDLADFVSNDLNYPTEKIAIVPNPIDAEIFCPEGNIAIEKDDRAIVLFVGRLEERKGIRYLIQAIPKIVSEYPKVRFIIIGNDTT